MTSRSDGRFHGGNPATRYEVASAIARAMAEMENRLVAEGHAPQDIVPYIERINLYVADEIDHLKQAQKELRATVNELLERIERREAHSTPLPPPAPPMSHPHVSPVPMMETRARTEVHADQRIHPVEGAAPVNAAPNAPQNKAALTRIRTRVADGKIGAVEGAATIRPAAAPVTKAPVALVKPTPIVSDEAAWEKSQSTAPAAPAKSSPKTSKAAIKQLEEEEMKVEDEAVAADESQPDIGWSEQDLEDAKAETPKVEAKPAAKPAKVAKTTKATPPKAATPVQTSKKSAPKAAPMPLGIAPAIETTHGAVTMPGANPFGSDEHDAAPVTAKHKAPAPAKAPITTASVATAIPMEAAEILDTPELAPVDGPSDEQLSNWSGSKGAQATAQAAPVKLAAASAGAAKKVFTRSAKAQSLLEQLRSRGTPLK